MSLMMSMGASAATSRSTEIMYVGKTKTVNYTVKTSNKKVAAVKKKGSNKTAITAKKQGTVTLKYYKGKKLKKIASVVVLNKSSLKYDTKTLTLAKGKSKTVKASAYKACKITYKTSNKKVATVSSKGKIKAVGKGSCKITAVISYKGATVKTYKKTVKVTDKAASTVSSDSSSKKVTLTKISASCKKTSVSEGYKFKAEDFTVYGHYSDGTKKKMTSFSITTTYTSSNGYFKVTVKSGGKETVIKVPVKNASGSGSSSGSSSSGSSSKKVKLTKISAECSKKTVKEGYQFKITDFTVYGHYSDGTKKRLVNFTVSTSYASTNGYYEILVKAEGMETTIKVPVEGASSSGSGSSNGSGGSSSGGSSSAKPEKKAIGIEVTCSKSEVEMGYQFKLADFTVYTLYSDGTKSKTASYGFRATFSGDYYTVTVTSGEFSQTLTVKAVKTGTSGSGSGSETENPGKTAIGIEVLFDKDEVPLGYDFQLEEFTVYVLYSDGTRELASGFGYQASYSDGYYHVKVTSGEFTKTIDIKATPPAPVLTSVQFKLTNSILAVGQELPREWIEVTAFYSDGSSKLVDDFTYDYTPQDKPGKYPVTITWGSAQRTVTITVVENGKSLKEARVEYKKPFLYLGEEVLKSDIVVTGTYTDGTTSQISDFTFTVEPAKAHNTKTIVTVTLTGYEKNLTFEVPTFDRTIPVEMTITVSKTVIGVNENIDRSTITLTATYRDGSQGTENDFLIDFTPKSTPGTYPVRVTCKGFTFDFEVQVVEM